MHISASFPTVVSVTQWKHIVFRSTNPWRGHGMFQSLVGVAYWQHVQVTCIPCCFCFPYLGIGSNVTNIDRMSTKTLSFPKRRFFLDICKVCFHTNGVIFVVTFEASTNFFATNLFLIISSAKERKFFLQKLKYLTRKPAPSSFTKFALHRSLKNHNEFWRTSRFFTSTALKR